MTEKQSVHISFHNTHTLHLTLNIHHEVLNPLKQTLLKHEEM